MRAKVGIEADRYGEKSKITTIITPEQNKNVENDWSRFEVRRRKAVIERAMKDAVGKNIKLK